MSGRAEPLLSVDAWILMFVSGLVTLGFAYLLRITTEPALRWWAMAWAVFLLDNLMSAAAFGAVGPVAGHVLVDLTYFTSPLIPFLLLGGALAYAGRPAPGWLVPSAIGVATARLLLAAADVEPLALWLSLATEVPLGMAAAVVLLRVARRRARYAIPALLGCGQGAIAVLEGASAMAPLTGTRIPWLTAVAACVILTHAGLQLLAVLSGIDEGARESRRLRARDLDLLRRLARASSEHSRVSSLVAAVLDALRQELPFDGLGVWLCDERGDLVRSQGFGPASRQLADYGAIPGDHPLVERVLRQRKPLYGGSLAGERSVPRSVRGADIGAYCILPLCFGEELLGVLMAAVRPGADIRSQERGLLEAVAEELSVALRHCAMAEERAGHMAALETERTRLRAVLETAPVGVLMEDADGRVAVVNGTGEEQLGIARSDWVGRPFRALVESVATRLVHPRVSELPRLDDSFVLEDTLVLEDTELQLRTPGGPLRHLAAFSSPLRTPEGEALGRVWITRELTEERRLQEQLWQSQKFEALGQLAGGISHDFNNQLAAILGNARHLQAQTVATDAETHEVLDDVVLAAEHCADLTRSLLAFSRRTPLERRRIDVAELLAAAQRLLRPLLPPSVELSLHADLELPELEADGTQMQQVLVNLAINARDAMEDRGRIEIRAELRDGPVDGGPADPRKPEQHLEIAVEDSGPGIPASIRERIFEPFFTTKQVGRGTGLGLSTVYGVVQAHGGRVAVDSTPGHGTTFRVALPLGSAGPG